MPVRCSMMLCVAGGSDASGVGDKVIAMPKSSKCCRELSAHQFGVSSIGKVMGLLTP